jgi:hypothetical protein
MEIEGRGAAPSAAVAELTSAAEESESKPDKPERVVQSRWLKPIGSYAQHQLARPEDASSYG